MSITINVPDTLRRAVESASGGRNTILYTAKGQPSYMVVIPKTLVQDLDASLGTGVHEAFVVNGVEKSELLIGQYQGTVLNGELVSQPGVPVAHSLNHDEFVSTVRANGAGWHCVTNAEWALLALLAWKNNTQPNGNSQYGRSSDNPGEYGVQENGRAIKTGLEADGGTRVLAGSGPHTWRHDHTPFGISDLNGNVWEWTPGLRLVDAEVQIIANNDAASSTIDMGAESVVWKAIDGASGNLVLPGSANTIKVADSGAADYTLVAADGAAFSATTNPGATPVSPAALQKLKRLGVFPVASSGLMGDAVWDTETGECLAIRGGGWYGADGAGVFALALTRVRGYRGVSIGARPAFVA